MTHSESNGAALAAAAWNEFGPRVATKTKIYQRAKKSLKLAANDRKDFDDALLRLARAHRGIISARVLK